jgi:phenylpyruvate tautomerase PptA (4-oxalocrotonate tautomerase family)
MPQQLTKEQYNKLADEISDLVSSLAMAMAEADTGVDSTDEDELQEYGENSFYGVQGDKENEISGGSFTAAEALVKEMLLPADLATFKALSKRVEVALTMTEDQRRNALVGDVLEALVEAGQA